MPSPTFTLTAVISADGYIARRAGEHPGSWASGEEQARFLAEVPGYDWAFMGRTTHETALRMERPPCRCIVLGGTTVHDWFLERDRIDRIELTIEPVRFGAGLPFLTGQQGDVTAELFARGFVLIEQQELNPQGTRLLVLAPRR
jgi:dihydrofolate reductase